MQAPPDHVSDRTTQGRRRLLAVVALAALLLVQAAWSFSTRPEPYPSVRLPAFGSAATAEGVFPKQAVAVAITYADGPDTVVDVDTLMTGFGPRTAGPSFEWAVLPDGQEQGGVSEDREAARAWVADRARALADPGREAVELVVRSCEVDIDVSTASVSETACVTEGIDL